MVMNIERNFSKQKVLMKWNYEYTKPLVTLLPIECCTRKWFYISERP